MQAIELSSKLLHALFARFPCLIWSPAILKALDEALAAQDERAFLMYGSHFDTASAAYTWVKKVSARDVLPWFSSNCIMGREFTISAEILTILRKATLSSHVTFAAAAYTLRSRAGPRAH